MGRKKQTRKKIKNPKKEQQDWNFVNEAGPGCFIARRDFDVAWMIEWEDIAPNEFEGEEVPEIAIDTEECTLSLCNVENFLQVAYITVYETTVRGRNGEMLPSGSTTDNQGNTKSCVTFIVLCPPNVFAHLCYLDVASSEDLMNIRIESDVQRWKEHPDPTDSHPKLLRFPLSGGPFLCTQSEGGQLTHFFSGNLHAIDFRCPIGTPLVAVGDGEVIEAKDSNTLTGIAVSNLFEWNSIILKLDNTNDNTPPLYAEYVHIQEINVKVGDHVKQGQIIGKSGSIGFSPEPHLHFSAFRSAEPDSPTVRVKFGSIHGKQTFLPKSGRWYDANGMADPI